MGIGDAIKDFMSGAAASASAAKDKLTDGATILRLETEIKQLQGDIDKWCGEIGRQYAAKYAGDYGGEFGSYLEQISRNKDKIKSLEDQISAIKGTRKCSKCGAEIDIDAAFCVKCGTKQAPAAARGRTH
ncbi:MAG: zinc ribbon domain-containing protein [Clostridia bacterium]|nr:zinc ribbon domain-containing protein [Clostridia bacterium]